MQMRMEYSTFATRSVSGGGTAFPVTNEFLWTGSLFRPAYTPAATLAAIEDVELRSIIDALDNYSSPTELSDGAQCWGLMADYNDWVMNRKGWVSEAGLMPDGRHFAIIDTDVFYSDRLSLWSAIYGFNPDSDVLPPGYSTAWDARLADVLAFKNGPAQKEFQVRNPTESEYLSFYTSVWDSGFTYLWGPPVLQDFWLYSIDGGDALVASDDTLIATTTVTGDVWDNFVVGTWEMYEYRYLLTGGAAQKFWTNFVSCVEDV